MSLEELAAKHASRIARHEEYRQRSQRSASFSGQVVQGTQSLASGALINQTNDLSSIRFDSPDVVDRPFEAIFVSAGVVFPWKAIADNQLGGDRLHEDIPGRLYTVRGLVNCGRGRNQYVIAERDGRSYRVSGLVNWELADTDVNLEWAGWDFFKQERRTVNSNVELVLSTVDTGPSD